MRDRVKRLGTLKSRWHLLPPRSVVVQKEGVKATAKLAPQLNFQISPGSKWADLLERTILSTTRILVSGFPYGFTSDDVRREVNFLLSCGVMGFQRRLR